MHRLAFGNQTVDLEYGADNSAITRCKDIEEWAKDIYSPATNVAKRISLVPMTIWTNRNPHIRRFDFRY